MGGRRRRRVGDQGLWLLAAPGAGEGLSLARRLAPVLSEWNQTVVVASEVAPSGAGLRGVRVEASRRESWGSVLRGLKTGGDSEVPLRGVVHLAGLDGAGAEAGASELAAALEASGSSALALTQALEDVGIPRSAGLWFITRGGTGGGRGAGGRTVGCGAMGIREDGCA